ncbi:hypothetical protein LCGC14_0015370 [marine sediment metagenome]|uniref:Uncharacterized protein n=1 Tax=marine sediment metagenome TaxID=412755 RepID=A0A0F9W157_9ZZZZ
MPIAGTAEAMATDVAAMATDAVAMPIADGVAATAGGDEVAAATGRPGVVDVAKGPNEDRAR